MKINIPIFKSIYEIDCSKQEENDIISIGKIVNEEIIALAEESNITDEKILMVLYIMALRKELENDDTNILQELENNISSITSHVRKIVNKINERPE